MSRKSWVDRGNVMRREVDRGNVMRREVDRGDMMRCVDRVDVRMGSWWIKVK